MFITSIYPVSMQSTDRGEWKRGFLHVEVELQVTNCSNRKKKNQHKLKLHFRELYWVTSALSCSSSSFVVLAV